MPKSESYSKLLTIAQVKVENNWNAEVWVLLFIKAKAEIYVSFVDMKTWEVRPRGLFSVSCQFQLVEIKNLTTSKVYNVSRTCREKVSAVGSRQCSDMGEASPMEFSGLGSETLEQWGILLQLLELYD